MIEYAIIYVANMKSFGCIEYEIQQSPQGIWPMEIPNNLI